MPALESDLRRQLENVIIQARDVAEGAARSALQKRAVDVAEPFSHFGPKEKELRNRLRARGRQVGDVRNADKTQSIDQLTQELAYEFWHRMLFARFLAENNLLMHPDGVAVSLEECEELAKDATPPAPNGFVLAARYASTMLPQIFRTDDVLLEIDFAPEQRLALEKLLASLPQKSFLADDSLGWVYQFWQSEEKKRVNESGEKIDGRTLPAVTQLFTEHYMVQFLLHNTIGAWWCGRQDIQGPPGGAGVPVGKSPVEMEYLRWRDDGTPAAGKFDGWPKTLAEFTMLDPCCGSGHFLVSGFNLLVPLRMHDENLTADKACDAVLRDNIFGLELDPRCTQIAAFAIALAAWKYPNAGGYRPLPPLNIACSGQGVTGKKDEWLALANGNSRLQEGLEKLYDLFSQANHLGSLIDPRREVGDIFVAGFGELKPLFQKALSSERLSLNADLAAIGVSARGIATAAELLSKNYHLVATNVPYLTRFKFADTLKDYIEDHYFDEKNDLATAFVSRAIRLCRDKGVAAIVSPQAWFYQPRYQSFRESLLTKSDWRLVAKLGPNAFETISGEVVNVSLALIQNSICLKEHHVFSLDAGSIGTPSEKDSFIRREPLCKSMQSSQKQNPDSRIVFGNESQDQNTLAHKYLGDYAKGVQGLATSDDEQFVRTFWEVSEVGGGWVFLQGPVTKTTPCGGREHILFWEGGTGRYFQHSLALKREGRLGGWKSGGGAWGKSGISVAEMSSLPCSLYSGEMFDHSAHVIVPDDPNHLLAIWCFCTSSSFAELVRKIDQKLNVTNNTLVKVPFDLTYWQTFAAEHFPAGVPPTHSTDLSQWPFGGDITTSTDPLQVSVVRLLGYHWPEQSTSPNAIDKLAHSDGILCLPGVRGEAAASERLLEILRAAYGKNWSDSVLHKLLTDAGCKAGTTLDDWLRNQFFEQHCKRFHNRPFIWHIWDGRKDGFSALVNYHKLDQKALENVTYSYLGDWITAQNKSDKAGADLRLGAAQELQAKLKLILAGEPPYDIFVRWKPLQEQAIGWHPDLNDGVRMNIRPFVEADILRKSPNIKWTKDRGKEPERDKANYPWFNEAGERVNDVHLTNEKKTAARNGKKGAK